MYFFVRAETRFAPSHCVHAVVGISAYKLAILERLGFVGTEWCEMNHNLLRENPETVLQMVVYSIIVKMPNDENTVGARQHSAKWFDADALIVKAIS